jgi:hypothetical protein
MDIGTMGESARLDYVIREHEKLQRQVAALAELLIAKRVASREEIQRVLTAVAEQPERPA